MANKGIWLNENTFITFEESRRKISEEIATRDRALNFIGRSMFFLPDPDPVLKNIGKDITVYQELLADSHLGAVVESREAGVLSLEWEIAREKSSARRAQVVDDLFKNLDLDEIMSGILNAPLFGYQPLEIMWEKVGAYILPAKVVAKPVEWFIFSPENELRFRTKNNIQGEPLPERKFLLARNKATYQNPYGRRVLSRCFWPVTFKRGGLKFWMKFIEKFGMPWVIGKTPRGTDQKEQDKLLDALEAMVQDAIAVIPDDSSVDTVESPFRASSGGLYQNFNDAMNMEMSKTVLGQTLTTQMQSTGSLAATQGHMQVREDIIDSDKKIVEGTLNALIKYIYEINFSSTEARPLFRMFEEEDVDKTLAERDKILTESGVKFTKDYFKKTYSFDDKDFEVAESPYPDSSGKAQRAKSEASAEGDGDEGKEFIAAHPERVEGPSGSPSQDQLERAADKLTGDAHALQSQASAMLEVIFQIADTSKSYEEFNKRLAEAYPEMDTESLEKLLEQSLFVSQSWGRLNAGED